MNCPKCQNSLRVASTTYESDSTGIYAVQKLVCTTPTCEDFAGNDLNNPGVISKIVRDKLN